MSAKLYMEKRGARRVGEAGLFPVEPWTAERLESFREGEDLGVTAVSGKRKGALNWYWAGLGTLLENLDDPDRKLWGTTRKLHNLIMEELGYVTRVYRIDRTYRIEVDSIAFEAMPDDDFLELFERARQLIVDWKGYDPFLEWKRLADEKKSWAQRS